MTSDMADPQPNIDQGQAPTHPQPTGPNMKAEALRLGRRGWPVLPLHSIRDGVCTCSKGQDCGSAGKHPRTRDWVKNTTTDTKTIASWWTRWPDANIGIATGSASNLVILDLDPGHGGVESLDALVAQHGPLPDTVEVLTGGGGVHTYFTHDGAEGVGNSVSKLSLGLDVRSDGGYVVAPPSMHASGRRYEWELSSHPDDVALATPPRWFVNSLTEPAIGSQRSKANGNDRLDPAVVLSGVPEGERNDTLFRFASRHCGLGLEREETMVLALSAASECDPPFPEEETRRIVNSVYSRYGPGTPPNSGSSDEAAPEVPWERFLIHWGNNIENLPRPEWLIDGIMTKGSFVVLYGPPGVGKTLVVLDQAGAIVSGQPWHGRRTEKGSVIYIAAEGVGDLGLRHEALRIGRDLDDLPNLGYITEPVNLYSSFDVDHLIGLLDGRRPALIIADTLARSMDGADENIVKDMNAVVKNVDRLRRKTGATVMLVHHPGHDKSRERGSSALRGAADVFIKLRGKVTDTVVMTCDKMKMAAAFDPISVRFEPRGQSLAVVSGGLTPTLTDHEANSLTLVSREPLTHKAWFEAFEKAGHGSKSTFERTRKTLKEKGFVEGGRGIHENEYSITDAGRKVLGVTSANEVSGAK